jgi:hypothetical protein
MQLLIEQAKEDAEKEQQEAEQESEEETDDDDFAPQHPKPKHPPSVPTLKSFTPIIYLNKPLSCAAG